MYLWMVPSSAQSLDPKKTVTADMLLSAEFWQLMRRGRMILAHLELYPDSPLLTTSHFLQAKYTFGSDTVQGSSHANKCNKFYSLLWRTDTAIWGYRVWLASWTHATTTTEKYKRPTFVVCWLYPRPSHSIETNTERLSSTSVNLKLGSKLTANAN